MSAPERECAVRVPGSSSNLGGGFDCVAVAADRWLTARASIAHGAAAGVTVERGGELAELAVEPAHDALWIGFAAACRAAGREPPSAVRFRAVSDIPVARGLGSSAAALVAGAALANELLALGLDRTAIVSAAAALEGHPENAAASVFGGATLSVAAPGSAALTVAPLDVHASLLLAFAVPQLTLETKRARAALPPGVPHATAVAAQARGAALVRGLATASPALLAVALDDVLHVPHRRALVPGYDLVTAAAVAAGAFGATLSGAGTTIVAVAPRERAAAVAAAMEAAWRATGVPATSFTSTFDVPPMSISPSRPPAHERGAAAGSTLHA